jgi:ferric-dicitrate binding protein FerR (iron transport regulator)
MEKNLLARILTGEATSEEKEIFYQKLSENKEAEEEFLQVKDLWMRASMNDTKIDTDSEFESLWAKINAKTKQTTFSIGRRIIQYAAIGLFILGIGGLSGYYISKNAFEYPESGTQKYTAMKGSVSIVEFPDGTKVWLNSGSELTYREDHKGKQRLAELTGEAYFEVTHRKDFPFMVKANQIVVKDLGTTFNIKAYVGDNYVETSLVEGKADILTSKGESMVSLKPGESAVYYPENKSIKLRTVEENVLSAWRDGKFVIRDQRLEDIFKELSRWYDVKFRFENEALRDYRYTGNIKKSTTAQHVMKMLKLTENFNYRIIEKAEQPDEIVIY